MQLTVTGKQLDVGDALRRHVADSLEGILGKYFGNAIDASAILSREAHLFDAQMSVHIIMRRSEAAAEGGRASQQVLAAEPDDDDAMPFCNRAHGGLNLVCHRTDGNFGWVDPGAERPN